METLYLIKGCVWMWIRYLKYNFTLEKPWYYAKYESIILQNISAYCKSQMMELIHSIWYLSQNPLHPMGLGNSCKTRLKFILARSHSSYYHGNDFRTFQATGLDKTSTSLPSSIVLLIIFIFTITLCSELVYFNNLNIFTLLNHIKIKE